MRIGGSADHLRGAAVYRALILEWQSSWQSAGVLAVLPLHVLSALGLTAFVAAPQTWRKRVLPLSMFALGVGLAYGSRRFLPLMAVLAVPGMAGAVSALWQRLPRGLARATTTGAAVLALGYVGIGVRASLRRPDVRVLERDDGAQRVARFIAAFAPADSRMFNAFNDGCWLVWMTAPRVQHYIDARNNLGAVFLARYVYELLPDPQRFEREARALDISLVLVREKDPKMQRLASHLRDAHDFRLVYWDGYHALYARGVARNRALMIASATACCAQTSTWRISKRPAFQAAALARDLRELRTQSAATRWRSPSRTHRRALRRSRGRTAAPTTKAKSRPRGAGSCRVVALYGALLVTSGRRRSG